jgi:hypothetical protein
VKSSALVHVLLALLVYAALVTVSSFAFTSLRASWVGGAPSYAAIFGPALSLFTHASYFLFAGVSVIVFPWLAVGLVRRSALAVGVCGFAVTWLGVGWWLRWLF